MKRWSATVLAGGCEIMGDVKRQQFKVESGMAQAEPQGGHPQIT
jgi:hypothetical protein